MPWRIGIDEAGYGPNLGPFVMTLVACRVPEAHMDADLWELLSPCVRRTSDKADGRLIVADSKQVYSSGSGLDDLERAVQCVCPETSLGDWVTKFAADDSIDLRMEAWFTGATTIPCAVGDEDQQSARRLWRSTCDNVGVAWEFSRAAIVPAPRFNAILDKWHSKGAVLSLAMGQLIRAFLETTTPEPTCFVIDKHGGRNTYSAALQEAFSDGFVIAEEEGRARSTYRVEGLDRPVRITFMPKADVEHFPVALASMVSKYARELLMREFNQYWQTQVPDLAPTAGYPVDAGRFMNAIRPSLVKLGIAEDAIWRRK